MFRKRSIRFRLTLWYTLVLSIILAVFGGLTWFSLRQRLLDELDKELQGRASRFEVFFRSEAAMGQLEQVSDELEEFSQALPPTHRIHLRGSKGFTFDYPDRDVPSADGVRRLVRQFSLHDEQFHLEVTTPIGDVQHTLELLGLLLMSLLPAVILLASVAGAFLSGRALRPVHEITASARSIGIENLSARLPKLHTEDELSRLTDVLNSMFGRLEDAVRTLSQFAGDASHELRTPLAIMRTTAELALRRERDPESYRQSLRQVLAEVERMTTLVEELLQLARNDTSGLQVPAVPVELRRLLHGICAEIGAISIGRQIYLRESLGGEDALVVGSEPSLRRLFLALIDNAVKYSRSGGEVVVSLNQKDTLLEVIVSDGGEGIAPEDLPHIFKRFYRADPARNGEGYGLGLALADSIARAHRAKIEVETSAGAGSVFRVAFPAHHNESKGSLPSLSSIH